MKPIEKIQGRLSRIIKGIEKENQESRLFYEKHKDDYTDGVIDGREHALEILKELQRSLNNEIN